MLQNPLNFNGKRAFSYWFTKPHEISHVKHPEGINNGQAAQTIDN